MKSIIQIIPLIKKNYGYGLFSLLLIIVIGFSNLSNRYALLTVDDFLKMLKERFSSYNEKFPEDKVYLQFDKPFYQPGETIWFSAYVRNGQDLKPSLQSDILHVELINPKGNVMQTINLIVKNGKTLGDFTINSDFSGGLYKVKAYTNWQKNEENPSFFEKEIQIQNFILPNLKMKLDFERKAFGAGDIVYAKLEVNTNENRPLSFHEFKFNAKLNGKDFIQSKAKTDEKGICYVRFELPKQLKSSDGLLNIMIDYQGQTESVSRSIPIILNFIKFSFFPEGGDMVCELKNKVAFRALNEFNKAADVEGDIIDERGTKITTFKSFHMGMGAFDLKPEKGIKYYAKITKPEGITEKFELPEALHRGYVLNCEAGSSFVNMDILSTEQENLTVVAQIRGKIYYANTFKAVAGTNKIGFQTNDLPIGVAQITLFDSKNIPRAERLVFVNKNKQLSVKIQTDKEKYLPREKVKMTISVKDERGMPMPASFSLSVVNDQLLSFADDKSGNILSKLLLETDIKDKVEEPAFYFNPKEEKADKALDYLLLTSGWRRYTWEKVINMQLPNFSFLPEKTIITGFLKDANSLLPIPDAKISLSNPKVTVMTDKTGRFTFSHVDLSEPVQVKINANFYPESIQQINQYGNTDLFISNVIERDRVMVEDVDMAKNEGAVVRKDAKGENNNVFENENPQNIVIEKQKNNRVKQNEINKKIPVDNQEIGDKQDVADGKVVDARERKARMNDTIIKNDNGAIYYRAKQFAAPIYDKQEKTEVRNDFRQTIYWNGNIELDRNGKTTIEFFNSDDISSFRAIAEGVAADGSIGRTEKTYFTQLPFSMDLKFPIEASTDDLLNLPLTLKNNTNSAISGNLKIKSPEGFMPMNSIPVNQTIEANQATVIYLNYRVTGKTGKQSFKVTFESEGLNDAISKEINISAKGFPVIYSFSGNEIEKTYSVNITNVVAGSIEAKFTAFPSVVSDILSGIESILGEPYGCFEQTSMSSYPNVMVMNYLKNQEKPDNKIMATADNLLDKGYKRLLTFETSEKGYEWFGGTPAHEALTAYGLMQFNDMKSVYKVDNQMIERTAKWIFERRDGNGGFKRNPQALDNFGGASPEITNAYIVYALAEAGFRNIQLELMTAYQKAVDSKDPYQLALLANAMFCFNDIAKAEVCMKLLYSKQAADGSWTGLTHSITRSTGLSLSIETTSFVIMAMIKSNKPNQPALDNAVKYLISSRSGKGGFGSTQGTIQALKALTEYAKYSKKTNEDGIIEFYVDNKKIGEKKYVAGEREPIQMTELEKYIKSGKHELKVKYIGCKNPLPYSIFVKYNTFLPKSDEKCVISLDCKLSATTTTVGETVRLSTTLINRTNEGQPMTVAIIGIPAGLTAQPWQLKELQEKKIVDFYETIGNSVVFYYRQMKPSEKKEINLDLKVEIPGEYEALASSAYLYYTNEFKSWVGLPRMSVR